MKPQLLALVGFMGTGKTTVGRILAQRWSYDFLDMDTLIEARAGKTIADIFAQAGEAAFRVMERELVRELAGRRKVVIATGGGVVLNSDNLHDFSQAGALVCLRASEEEILRRLAGSNDRPLLAEGERIERIRVLLAGRRRLYEAVCLGVDTTGITPAEVADRIQDLLSACLGGRLNHGA